MLAKLLKKSGFSMPEGLVLPLFFVINYCEGLIAIFSFSKLLNKLLPTLIFVIRKEIE